MTATDPARDREAVEAFLANRDEAAFRSLYAAHAPRLYLSLLRLCGGREAAAEEALQEAWIRAAEGLAAFAWRSSLRTWLYGIAWNVWREQSRARARAGISLEAIEEVPAAPPTALSDARVDLERALRGLPEASRTVLVLHDIEGYTHEEIGALLEISPGTSKSQLARARENLRRRLDPVAAGAREEEERT